VPDIAADRETYSRDLIRPVKLEGRPEVPESIPGLEREHPCLDGRRTGGRHRTAPARVWQLGMQTVGMPAVRCGR
jgi:hypothetical protein